MLALVSAFLVILSLTPEPALAEHLITHSSPLKRPVAESKAQASIPRYFNRKEEEIPQKAKEWEKKILSAMDKDLATLRRVIEDFLIEDQMFLEENEEREVFGKPLKEFPEPQRRELVREYTLRQKKMREKLLNQVAEKLNQSDKTGAKTLGEAISDIKKDHLDAYDRVVKEIDSGTIGTETTFCFTCGRDEEIGKSGYTFGAAMEEAAARVVARFSEKPAISGTTTQNSESQSSSSPFPSPPSSQPHPSLESSPIEKAARDKIQRPVLQGSRAGQGRQAFEKHMDILRKDPSLSETTLKSFLKAGPYAMNNANYRNQVDRMSREEMFKAVMKFLDGNGPYNHCPSCNLGAGKRL